MEDEVVTYPETSARATILRSALAWLAANFDGTDVPMAHEHAVRAALLLPQDGPLNARTIKVTPARRLNQVFGEIVQTAIVYNNLQEPNTPENVIAAKAYELTPAGVNWLEDQDRALDVAFGVVMYYLTAIPGGLIEATADLSVGFSADAWDDLLGGSA